MSIQSLREERTAKAREYRNILDQNPGKLPDDIKTKLDALAADITDLDEAIARHEKAVALAADACIISDVTDAAARKAKDTANPAAAIYAKWLRGGDRALSEDDFRVLNTMSTTTDSEGGYTVPRETATSIIEALKAFGGMRDVATIITTASGAPLNYPTSDGTSEEGEIVDQNAAASDADASFGTVGLPVYKFSSKTIAVPIELLQDSGVDIEAFIRSRIATRVARIQNRMFTLGTGTGQPSGILKDISAGKVGATGQAATVTYDDLVDLEHSVDPAYRALGARWMFHDLTLKAVKKLKDGDGRPLWMPDVAGSAPATILGYGYAINQNMAVMAANAKSILFGHLKAYTIRDAMSVEMYRFTDSAFMKKGQIGFLAFCRSGGVNTDTNAIKFYQNSAT
ncbi:phage major capsid protein [Nitratidesulfovibrio vulgaris]|uniref:Major capsid protein, HK97 family n=1 Tax=Nitratidesulfovibrio vulgaris (strain ATCC 29579 / DSM 644 / CCUG 34227 / NCIMB 8303 / VKM B-1760 / Hildenborough) TaxID=882 RepID=Q72BY4_NITV2|nr:phage major capsid protein [Nitratidesulfovibrio vulgaris]AAS95978.1 major capsid protein, HK97 family [Nitratidesulfovibrio vulgaris str. Hildenborough]ADP86944.1 phage major capsid protein, HK97 family [Nitratidesulfovibrio vulgaris RCH1]WCB45045.1 phage major capsid protein [Nitratidesulfovibrio vulgaris]